MLILKSTHERILAAEKAGLEAVIVSLQDQIADLRRLVFVPKPTHAEEFPIRAANAILDGQEVMPTIDPEQEKRELEEANRILSGDYDRVEETW